LKAPGACGAPGLELRQLEDGFDQTLQLLALLVDDREEVPLHLGVRRPHVLEQRFHVGEDDGERRLELVAHDRDERRLQVVQLLRALGRLFELPHASFSRS
jgi:hypothetical protein